MLLLLFVDVSLLHRLATGLGQRREPLGLNRRAGHAGEPNPALPSFGGSVWFAALVALFWIGIRARVPRLLTGLAVIGLALSRPISQNAIGGNADVLISLILLGVTIELRSVVSGTGGRAAWCRAAGYLTLGALTKNEGIAIAVVALPAVFGWFFLHERRLATEAVPLGVPAAIAIGWQLYINHLGAAVEQVGTFRAVGRLWSRAGAISEGLGTLLIYRSWVPVTLVLAVAAVVAVSERLLPPGPGAWILAGYLIVLLGVYFTTSMELEWLLLTTLERLLSHLVPAALLMSLCAIAGSASSRPGATFPRT